MIILFKYCADVKKCESFKVLVLNSALSIIYYLTNSMYLVADKFSDPKILTMIV